MDFQCSEGYPEGSVPLVTLGVDSVPCQFQTNETFSYPDAQKGGVPLRTTLAVFGVPNDDGFKN